MSPRESNPRHKPTPAEHRDTMNPRAEAQELRYMTTKPGEARTTFDASQNVGDLPAYKRVLVCWVKGVRGRGVLTTNRLPEAILRLVRDGSLGD